VMVKPLGDFTRFIETYYEGHILPILPVGAKLLPRDDGTTLDASNKGKIPRQIFVERRWVERVRQLAIFLDQEDGPGALAVLAHLRNAGPDKSTHGRVSCH
jgi:hypothetical protein